MAWSGTAVNIAAEGQVAWGNVLMHHDEQRQVVLQDCAGKKNETT